REVLITGRIDVLAYRGNEKIVYEIKTARSDVGIPHQHHIEQLRIYMNMVNAQKGILLYITPDRVTEYYVTNPMSDEELVKLVEEFLKFNGPRYEWECNYCVYSVICPLKKTNTMRR
ncbi:MAG: PD-(D/E)XK nuclease family protein, partial [Deltaproteobacteria bacterium]|nr:PD-(D/E)XK nuclease family protein [Deltaproteobacteria bacterium]